MQSRLYVPAVLVLAVLGVWLPIGTFGQTPQPAPTLKCEIGPVNRTYGGTNWLVYSCDDNQSVVLLSAPGNPASPFYFILSPKQGRYTLEGEGTGNKRATEATAQALRLLSASDIAALIAQTKRRPGSR